MGSLKYEILYLEPFKYWNGKQPSSNTIQNYKTFSRKFGDWCKSNYSCRHEKDCRQHIQNYADYLVGQGKSAATVHTYLAGICFAFQVPLSEIKKPERHTSDITRSRGVKAVDRRKDTRRDVSPRLYDFAERVGTRRHEYLRLRGNNLKLDESGYLCVEVIKGKGGKYQLQRILPPDELFIRSYFTGKEEFVFQKKELQNKIDLHNIRAQVAKRAYQYYTTRIQTEIGYQEKLTQEIQARWSAQNSRKWVPHEVEGKYRVRGKNRALVKKHGLQLEYDRLALMAVSVFHLSHWRNDVTVGHYLLAV